MKIPWFVPLIASISIGYVLHAILMKRLADRGSRSTTMLIAFCGAASIALFFGLSQGSVTFDRTSFILIGIGFFNAIAARAHVEAQRINMSFTSLFLVLDDVLAMALAYLILSEGKFLTAGIVAGVTMSVMTALFFTVYRSKKRELLSRIDELERGTPSTSIMEDGHREWKLLMYVLFFSITWGVAIFSMRYYNVGPVQLPASSFLWCWYTGAASGTALIYLLDRTPKPKLELRQKMEALTLSLTMISSLACTYWSLSYADKPQVALQPIYLIAGMILPTLLGLYYFKELKGLDGNERLLMALAVIGGVVIGLQLS